MPTASWPHSGKFGLHERIHMIYIMVVTGVNLTSLIIRNHSPQPSSKQQNVFTLDDYADKNTFFTFKTFLKKYCFLRLSPLIWHIIKLINSLHLVFVISSFVQTLFFSIFKLKGLWRFFYIIYICLKSCNFPTKRSLRLI